MGSVYLHQAEEGSRPTAYLAAVVVSAAAAAAAAAIIVATATATAQHSRQAGTGRQAHSQWTAPRRPRAWMQKDIGHIRDLCCRTLHGGHRSRHRHRHGRSRLMRAKQKVIYFT